MKQYVDKTYAKKDKYSFSVAIDGSKVAKALQIDFRYNAVLGGAVDRHFIGQVINDSNRSEEGLKKLKTILHDDTIKKADEVKLQLLYSRTQVTRAPTLYLSLGRNQQMMYLRLVMTFVQR